MIKWNYEELNNDVVMLLKTLKSQYLTSTLDEGNLCFNKPQVFQKSDDLAKGQADPWDSNKFFTALDLYVAPVISDTPEGTKYGKPIYIGTNIPMREISGQSKMTPVCCFRKVDESDFKEENGVYLFRLDEVTVERIKDEFEHDSFLLVVNPRELINRILKQTFCFARSVHYGEIDEEYQKYLDAYDFNQAEMFQKREEYAWQKEFRIIIRADNSSDLRKFMRVGSLQDIAIGGKIDQLKSGFLFADSEKALNQYIEQKNRKE
ncbi:MAG: hypothetical protein IJK26_06505 [Clostridia bacterium]|nr:hypothetical protein [Clostridia bacterium]